MFLWKTEYTCFGDLPSSQVASHSGSKKQTKRKPKISTNQLIDNDYSTDGTSDCTDGGDSDSTLLSPYEVMVNNRKRENEAVMKEIMGDVSYNYSILCRFLLSNVCSCCPQSRKTLQTNQM